MLYGRSSADADSVARSQPNPARMSTSPKRLEAGDARANRPTAIGTPTISARTTVSSTTCPDTDPDAITIAATAHAQTPASAIAETPSRVIRASIDRQRQDPGAHRLRPPARGASTGRKRATATIAHTASTPSGRGAAILGP